MGRVPGSSAKTASEWEEPNNTFSMWFQITLQCGNKCKYAPKLSSCLFKCGTNTTQQFFCSVFLDFETMFRRTYSRVLPQHCHGHRPSITSTKKKKKAFLCLVREETVILKSRLFFYLFPWCRILNSQPINPTHFSFKIAFTAAEWRSEVNYTWDYTCRTSIHQGAWAHPSSHWVRNTPRRGLQSNTGPRIVVNNGNKSLVESSCRC